MRLAGVLGGMALAACAAACATPPLPKRTLVGCDARPIPFPNRWVHTNGRASIGPAVPGGIWVLLGGRRAIVEAGGNVRPERVATPEALSTIASVPTPTGTVLLGIGSEHVYRFDDSLGAGTPIVKGCHFASGFWVREGIVEVRLEGGIAGFDPRTGARVCGPDPRDCLAGTGLSRDARSLPECPPLDPPAEERATKLLRASEAPAMLRWIAATGADPLALAVTNGARLDERTAVVASHGLVAKVDLARGGILELAEYEEKRPAPADPNECTCDRAPKDDGPCEAARAGSEFWLLCPWTGDAKSGAQIPTIPFGVLTVRGGPGGLQPKLVRSFEVLGRDDGRSLVASSTDGGWLLQSPCRLDDPRALLAGPCLRQPDGTFSSFAGASSGFSNDALPPGVFVPLLDA